MTPYTETYHKARLAGALPVFLFYLGTDRCLRCFGKHTPTPEQVGDDALEWSARVLTFGDFRQSLSADSESYLQGLFEEEVSSYGAELDSADGYFQEIAGSEVWLNGDCILLQGYDYPGFAHDDFIPMFYGKIDTFEFDELRFKFTAIQAVAPQVPEDPSVTSESIYALSNAGVGFTGASESYPYEELEDSFYDEESWTYTAEVTLDTITESVFFRLENAAYNNDRIRIGIDGDDKLYLTYTDDVDTSSPTYQTLTSNITAGSGTQKITVNFDRDAGQVTFKRDGVSQIIDLTPVGGGFVLENTWTSLAGHRGMDVDSSGKIYVANYQDDRVDIYNADGTFDTSFGSSGTGEGQFQTPFDVAVDGYGNIYVTDGSRYDVQKFDSSHAFVLKFGSRGAGDGQFYGPAGVCVSTDDSRVYVSDLSSDRIQSFSSLGAFIAKGGSSGTGDGNLDQPTGISCDSLDNVYVCDFGNNRIVKFTSSLSWSSNPITGVNYPRDIVAHSSYLYFSTVGSPFGVHKYTNTGTSLYSYSLSSGSYGLAYNPTTGRTYSVIPGSNFYDLSEDPGSIVLPDFSDNGSSDDVIVLEDTDGASSEMSLGNWQTVNTDNTATEWEDIIDGVNVTLDDGTWVDSTITIETYTETLEKLDSADPTEELIFPDTSQYSSPGENQQNVILPLPYGNVRENSDGGVWVCPLIDNVNFVYCVAGWPIQSVANGNTVDIYVDGVLQSSGYTFDESNDYEGQGDVAIVTFTSDPGGTVTAKCNGKWVDGELPTNPVDIIEDFMGYAAELVGTAAWEQDPTTFAIARNVANTASYKCAGIITSNNSLGYWIKSILKSFLGGFRFNSSGKLEIKLTPLEESEAVHEWLDEYEAITAIAKQNVKNICGRIIVNYANSYAEIDRRFKGGGESSYFRTADKSQDAINPQSWTLDFDWCRNSDNISLMQDILLALYADPEYNVTYQGQDFKYVPLSLTDQVQATFSFLKDNDNQTAEDIIYRIREKTINLDNFTTSMMLQSVNFVAVSDPSVNNVTLGGENVTLGGEQVTMGGA